MVGFFLTLAGNGAVTRLSGYHSCSSIPRHKDFQICQIRQIPEDILNRNYFKTGTTHVRTAAHQCGITNGMAEELNFDRVNITLSEGHP